MKVYYIKKEIINTLRQWYNEQWTMDELDKKLKELKLTNFSEFIKDVKYKVNDLINYYKNITISSLGEYYTKGYDLQVEHRGQFYQEEYNCGGETLLASNKKELLETFVINLIVGKINRENN